jgi:hypothetical protein
LGFGRNKEDKLAGSFEPSHFGTDEMATRIVLVARVARRDNGRAG